MVSSLKAGRAIAIAKIEKVIELGAQNLYLYEYPEQPYADVHYKRHGIDYTCIDLSGENKALQLNLGEHLPIDGLFDLVTDFGTSEHIGSNGKHDFGSFYQCLKSKHDLLRVGGIMISENPKTGNWPFHGFNYYTTEFYEKLAEANGYEIHELGEHPAMGNERDGWNVFCMIQKSTGQPFMSKSAFKDLPYKLS